MSVLFKIIFISIVTTHVAESAFLRCYLDSINNMKELPLKKSPEFYNTTYIKPNTELIIITHGYSAEISELHEAVITNYINEYGDTKSYCALNWKTEANAYIGNITDPIKNATNTKILLIDYPAVAEIAARVGKELGVYLLQMESRGLEVKNISLIGHSEGAHLFGNTGREVSDKTGSMIGQIIGLDPAKPPVERALDKTCAEFVWCVHTNPYLFGTNEARCHVDFWPNYGCTVQPGCPSITNLFNNNRLCSHIRALLLMADAVKNPDSLLGRKASSYYEWVQSNDDLDPADVNQIGPNINSSNPGSFYLSTNAESPFGQDSAGMDPEDRTCPEGFFNK